MQHCIDLYIVDLCNHFAIIKHSYTTFIVSNISSARQSCFASINNYTRSLNIYEFQHLPNIIIRSIVFPLNQVIFRKFFSFNFFLRDAYTYILRKLAWLCNIKIVFLSTIKINWYNTRRIHFFNENNYCQVTLITEISQFCTEDLVCWSG